MTELINSADLPVSIDANKFSETTIGGKHEIPPGASSIRHVRGRGTEWYCRNCLDFISPLWIRVDMRPDGIIYPACLECFYTELIESKGDVEAAIEETKDVAKIESVDSTTSASGKVPSL